MLRVQSSKRGAWVPRKQPLAPHCFCGSLELLSHFCRFYLFWVSNVQPQLTLQTAQWSSPGPWSAALLNPCCGLTACSWAVTQPRGACFFIYNDAGMNLISFEMITLRALQQVGRTQ